MGLWVHRSWEALCQPEEPGNVPWRGWFAWRVSKLSRTAWLSRVQRAFQAEGTARQSRVV